MTKFMIRLIFVLLFVYFYINSFGQAKQLPPQTKIMTLGVFHFAYPNLDAVKTDKNDQISVLDEPYQTEIIAISNAISNFKPTIIAIEALPDQQFYIDSLYSLYENDKFKLGKNEIFQLGFRIAKNLRIPVLYCVDDLGHHYNNIEDLLTDSIRTAKLEEYYFNSADSIYKSSNKTKKDSSIIHVLSKINDPLKIKESLSSYLLNPFKYEEQPMDFAGVDFETGRWFNRNLRIYRNIQRIPHRPDDRILLIIGVEHLNLLNIFFEVSKEFEFVSPLPYLIRARTK